jgi:hypothetical protein
VSGTRESRLAAAFNCVRRTACRVQRIVNFPLENSNTRSWHAFAARVRYGDGKKKAVDIFKRILNPIFAKIFFSSVFLGCY